MPLVDNLLRWFACSLLHGGNHRTRDTHKLATVGVYKMQSQTLPPPQLSQPSKPPSRNLYTKLLFAQGSSVERRYCRRTYAKARHDPFSQHSTAVHSAPPVTGNSGSPGCIWDPAACPQCASQTCPCERGQSSCTCLQVACRNNRRNIQAQTTGMCRCAGASSNVKLRHYWGGGGGGTHTLTKACVVTQPLARALTLTYRMPSGHDQIDY